MSAPSQQEDVDIAVEEELEELPAEALQVLEADEEDTEELEAITPEQIAEARAPREEARPRRRLGEMLIEAGLITDEQLQQALRHQKAHGGRLGSVLVALGHLAEEALESQLSLQLGIDVCEVASVAPSPEVLALISEDSMRRLGAIPLRRERGQLVVGMLDPHDRNAVDELILASGGHRVTVEMITEATFRRFMETRFPSQALRETDDGAGGMEIELLLDEVGQTGTPEGWEVAQISSFILENAVRRRASDIHIEPYEDFSRVRMRVDGELYTLMTPPQRAVQPLVRRFKLMAGLEVGDRRQPRDGQARVEVDGRPVELRISTLPTAYGEKCVLRLLRHEPQLSDLTRLGFRPDQLEHVRQALAQPQGLVLVTGPTGSGKTTTLHAMLNEINEANKNIVTIEDPVEAAIPGVNHVPVPDDDGGGHLAVLRSILRQDPDVVLVGEIRDPEVAAAAVKASLTGHLVISSLHTNGVVESFLRLRGMGVDPWLLAGSLELLLAQRLLRRVCTKCSTAVAVDAATAREYSLTEEQVETASLRKATGCAACLRTGYRGRVAVFESLRPDTDFRRALREGGAEQRLVELSEERGAVTTWEAGLARALAGETTLEELRRRLGGPG